MKRFAYPLAILASSVLASACTDDLPPSDPLPPGSTQGGEHNTIDHPGASRELDIFAAGAPEVIAAFSAGTIARCPGAKLFDASNACQPEGITCLTGVPATAEHVQFCNLPVTSASELPTGQKLAVAAILAAVYTCE